jgi:hypothetical protein
LSAGVTGREPLGGTLPIPLSKLTDVAFEELQVRVAVDPAFTVDGFMTTLIVGLAMTVTVTEAVVTPPEPVAVAV